MNSSQHTNSSNNIKKEVGDNPRPHYPSFRRENSDFFPASRHSAIFEATRSSSGLFSSRRASEIGGQSSIGEPILTDFVPRDNSGSMTPARPRREKTEGDIVLRRQELRNTLEAHRRDNEERFSREGDRLRRRTSGTTTRERNKVRSPSSTHRNTPPDYIQQTHFYYLFLSILFLF